MRNYANKEELKNEIKKTYAKYIAEFEDIPEELKDKRCDEVERTPAENLAYQVGWTSLILQWERDEKSGTQFQTPSKQFKWNELGKLYQWFTDTYVGNSIAALREKLEKNLEDLYAMIDAMTEDEVFGKHQREWADKSTKTAVWEVYKFIHTNTVAPFGTFRTKIRKWKKSVLQ